MHFLHRDCLHCVDNVNIIGVSSSMGVGMAPTSKALRRRLLRAYAFCLANLHEGFSAVMHCISKNQIKQNRKPDFNICAWDTMFTKRDCTSLPFHDKLQYCAWHRTSKLTLTVARIALTQPSFFPKKFMQV